MLNILNGGYNFMYYMKLYKIVHNIKIFLIELIMIYNEHLIILWIFYFYIILFYFNTNIFNFIQYNEYIIWVYVYNVFK